MHHDLAPGRPWLVLAALALTACVDSHGGGKPFTLIDDSNCVGCHQADYDRTTQPPHAGQFPTTCGDCHTTQAWQPAVGGGHPESRFAIASGAHQGIACRNCHKPELGTSTAGANTDCITCHVQAESDPRHVGVANYGFQPTMRHFCLTCHPAGTAQGRPHPEARFPIASGAHRIPCADCHNSALGPPNAGQNTSCTGCHTGNHSQTLMNTAHRTVSGYAWSTTNQHFCLQCHPAGTAIAGTHPEARFPIASGAHQMPCADCHIAALGSPIAGQNTSCTGCHTGAHTRARVDSDHGDVGNYAWSTTNQHFCLPCHPRGRN